MVLLVLANEFVQGIYHLYFTLSLHRVQKNIILSERVYLLNMCKTNLKYLDNFFFFLWFGKNKSAFTVNKLRTKYKEKEGGEF